MDLDGAHLKSTAAECRDLGAETLEVVVDVSDPPGVRRAVDDVALRFGGVDCLVNNAAMFSSLRNQPFEEIDPVDFDRVMAVNARGPFLLCQAVAPYMRRRGGGKIVNLVSGTLLSAPGGLAHYVASKGALFALTRVLARELGPDKICVNSIAPGLTVTEGLRSMYPDSYISAARSSRSLARDEVPDDITGTLVYLLSSDSDFVTGQMLAVNGGAQFW